MCIYYKGKTDLNYNSQEHLIPASLGGRIKLPKGYVSDEFNNDISKLEQKFIRESLISIPRQFDGPGKRGRMGEKHAVKSKVLLFVSGNENQFSLGYMQRGKPKEIPTLLLDLETGNNQFTLPTSSPDEARILIETFSEKTRQAENLKIKRMTDERLPLGFVLIGIQNDVEENFDCFIFKNEATSVDIAPSAMRDVTSALVLNMENGRKQTSTPVIQQTATIEIDFLRIYGKIAFNFLAAKFGSDAALLPIFDGVREWIVGRSATPHANLDLNGENPFAKANPPLPDKCHTVVLFRNGTQLYARVAIYKLPAVILLANDFQEQFTPVGLVCDWANQQEKEVIFQD